jgi:hypothetical protein
MGADVASRLVWREKPKGFRFWDNLYLPICNLPVVYGFCMSLTPDL